MDVTVDSLVAQVAHELRTSADRLTGDMTAFLRREVPELWADPDMARMTTQNIAEHTVAALTGLEHGIEPDRIELPPADVDRVRRLARRGIPVTAMLRAHRLAQGIAFDRALVVLPRLTDDAELIGAVARRLLAATTAYVDRLAEQGVLAYQEERERRLRWRLTTVTDAGMRIGTTLDIARTTRELADFATEHFADRASVDLLDSLLQGRDTPAEEPLVLRRVAEEPASTPEGLHTYPDGSPQARALTTGHPVRHHTDAPPAHSTLVVPLRARGTTLGVAQFSRHRNPDRYDDEDLLLAQEIAARAAVAVDNARRYTNARATALSLQRSLLPSRTPPQSALEVACRYLPAGDRLGVGGDWYDVIPLSGARVALVVGDVVGHGVHAAATMGRLRTAVRTLADIDLPPDELLTHLDDVVLRLSAEASTRPDAESADIGATCLYAVYDPVSGCCTMARAGHVLPSLMARDGTVDTLDLPPGPPLGLGGLPFEATEVVLPEDTLLALYTDGLLEARDHDIDTALALLHQALAQPAPSLETACDTVLDTLLPAHPPDDVALLLARTRTLGDGQVASWDLAADPAAVSVVRSRVSEQLGVWGLEDLDFSTELVVSELVTNAIRYGRPPIRLRLIHDRSLLCEVSDASSTTPHQRRARTDDEGGRGLFLVAQLAEHWGTRHARHGKTVWAELNDGLTC
ncbi:SpoIIE family protein phosphatase [Streptomyces sp. NBC_00287]|uniref:ATP-binding SpoIIE family protein phosphatase n=1 Tax=Streptomyces sp. NBC_00287 TaxID=2975702 RepID=UPI002E2A2B9B|nr:SpoIIE family protein phosphatase [Streptomyces sp. NBC_00287]